MPQTEGYLIKNLVWDTTSAGWVPQGISGYPAYTTTGLGIGIYDYVSLTQAALTDTYTFKTGGVGGTTIATVVLTFTDSGKGTLSTVVKTPVTV